MIAALPRRQFEPDIGSESGAPPIPSASQVHFNPDPRAFCWAALPLPSAMPSRLRPLGTTLAAMAIVCLVACCDTNPAVAKQADPLLHVNDKSYLDGYPPLHKNGQVNVVVEIPAGTTAKWEVTKPAGELRWEVRNGSPRVVKYLGYPGNYGMIPRTLSPKDQGGDGDPLDVLVLGAAVERGAVIPARIIGVMRMLDGGEQDDKLIAVREGTEFAKVHSVAQLRKEFGGVETIVRQWFANYKGPGKIEVKTFEDAQVAHAILEASIAAFEAKKRYEE